MSPADRDDRLDRDSRFVPLVRFTDRHEAEIVRGMLESSGVPTALRTDDAGGAYPVLSPSMGATVLVPDVDLDRARDVLAETVEAGRAADDGRDAARTSAPTLAGVEATRRRGSRGAVAWIVAAVLLVVVFVLGVLGSLPAPGT